MKSLVYTLYTSRGITTQVSQTLASPKTERLRIVYRLVLDRSAMVEQGKQLEECSVHTWHDQHTQCGSLAGMLDQMRVHRKESEHSSGLVKKALYESPIMTTG